MIDLKLLLVEDDEILLNRLERILKREVKYLYSFSSPIEALKKIEEIKPDLVITDIKMPQMNGLEMVDKIRTVCTNIPIIVASAFSEPKYFQEAIKLKIEKFVIKPIDIDELISTIERISEKIQLEKMFLEKNRLLQEYKEIVDKSNHVTKTDKSGKITYVNEKFAELCGYTKEELIGKNHNIVRHPSMPKSFFKRLWKTILDKKIWQGTIKSRDKSGKIFYVETTISPIVDDNGDIIEFISIKNDVTELILNKKLLQNQIVTDILTNIPNRLKLKSDIININKPVLILIDIDNFQEINNLFGFYFGDQVLIYIANTIKDIAEKYNAKYYRISSDEYAILFYEHVEKEVYEEVINKLKKTINEKPFSFNSINYDIDLSYGVAISNNTEKNTIIALAETAMNQSRKNSSLYEIYSENIDQQAIYEHNFRWNKKLKEALADNRITVFYQPIVSVEEKKVKKYECLVRYIDDDGTIVSPFEFLTVAKRSRVYHDITKRVITIACETFNKLKGKFSINFSIEDFYNIETVEYLIFMVKQYDLGGRIIVEILESEGIDNYNYTIEVIEKLKSNGIKIAIDDFGTGYSNFAYLISLDIDILKIDGSLIKDVSNDFTKQSI